MSEADSDEAAAARRRLREILGDPPPAPAVPRGGLPPESAATPDDTGARLVVPDDGGTRPVVSDDGVRRPVAPDDGVRRPVAPDDGADATSGAIRRAVRLTGPGAFDPGRRGVRALALVAVVVVLIAAFLAWRARPRPEPVPAPVGVPAEAAAGRVEAGQGDPAGRPNSGGAAELVVAVAGKVRRPGLVRLPAGARVADAITAAGGALPGTDVAFLNLARKVTDGELILVGVTAPPGVTTAGGSDADGTVAPGGPPGALPGGKVNLNTATVAQLDSLPGVGPVLAQRIVDHRERHGGFRSVADLRQVDGIGEARFEQLQELVTV